MAKNLTTLHKQITTVQSKLEALDKRVAEQGEMLRDIRQQTRLMSRLVSLMTQLREADQERLDLRFALDPSLPAARGSRRLAA